MEIISFDIIGKFAHFRKFYSNSTALSFTIPPRTTLMGMLGAILGRERDSYYEDFASDKILLSVGVKSKLKKSFHRVNFLDVKSVGDFRGKMGRIQTPLEVITAEDLRKQDVVYRVFIGHTEEGQNIFKQIKEKLLNKEQQFNLTLGIANFSASIQNVIHYPTTSVKEQVVKGTIVELNSIANSEDVDELKIELKDYNFIEEDLLPADFLANFDREVKSMNRVLFTQEDIPLKVQLTGTYFEIIDGSNIQNIQFLS